MAFTNPLYDPITVRLALARPSSGAQVHLPTTNFPISALKDAWAYDGEEEDDASLAVFDEGPSGTLGRTAGSRVSMGGVRKAAVERKENVSKIGLELLLPQDYMEARLEVSGLSCIFSVSRSSSTCKSPTRTGRMILRRGRTVQRRVSQRSTRRLLTGFAWTSEKYSLPWSLRRRNLCDGS